MVFQKKVVKRDKAEEIFSREKLCKSLIKIGADEHISRYVCTLIDQSIESEVSTDEIFKKTRDFLYRIDPDLSALYSLERGLSSLGPSGFVFEQYVGAIFVEMGYKVKTNVYMKGEGVEHEIDVYAQKGNVIFLTEAKYKNDFKLKTHIDHVMYADARLQDIRRRAERDGDAREYYMWIITNTKFTDNAIHYAEHRDIQLLGWDYPPYINLMKLVSEKKLYPVTILPSITKSVLKKLSHMNLILVKYLTSFTVDDFMKKFGTSHRLAKRLVSEVDALMERDLIRQ